MLASPVGLRSFMSSTPRIVCSSHIGRVRARNEDAYVVDPQAGVVVVADGMGGHPGGDVASRIAADAVAEHLRAHRDDTPALRVATMVRSVRAGHEAVRDRAAGRPGLEGMGTTVVALTVDPDHGSWVLGHVGDSRAYRLRDASFDRLTRDDTWVQERVESGLMTPEEARGHPYAQMLSQCLGLQREPVPNVQSGRTQAGDLYLLCTDGLTAMLSDEEIGAILLAHPRALEEAVEGLVSQANARGGYDNVTVALVEITPPAPAE